MHISTVKIIPRLFSACFLGRTAPSFRRLIIIVTFLVLNAEGVVINSQEIGDIDGDASSHLEEPFFWKPTTVDKSQKTCMSFEEIDALHPTAFLLLESPPIT